MSKALSEMTLAELWALFPIVLTAPNPQWAAWYAEEARKLAEILSPHDVRIHHIGSTAIRGIWAKPIVDILAELPPTLPMPHAKEILVQNGWLCMSEQTHRISLNKGYTSEGFAERVFHLHLRACGDCDELYFRDYLNAHSDIAKQYEVLKRSLWKQFEHDRDGYTAAKIDFIAAQTANAKAHCGNQNECTAEM